MKETWKIKRVIRKKERRKKEKNLKLEKTTEGQKRTCSAIVGSYGNECLTARLEINSTAWAIGIWWDGSALQESFATFVRRS